MDSATSLSAMSDVFSAINVQAALIFSAVFLCASWYLVQRIRNLPPGPMGLPGVGTIPFLGRDMRKTLVKWAEQYGDVYSMYLGSTLVVVVNDYNTIRETLVKQGANFAARPGMFFIEEITEGKGIVSTNGKEWKEQRRFAHSVLRDFGMGKSLIEAKVIEESTFFLSLVAQHEGKPAILHHAIGTAVANIVASISFGKRFEYDDPVFVRYFKLMNTNFELLGGAAGALNFFPWLKYIPGDPFKYKVMKEVAVYMVDEFRRFVNEHKANLDDNDSRDFIDAYLKEMKKHSDDPQTTFTERSLVGVIGDLFGAGTETTVTTLGWGILFMLHYPLVQRKVQAEIDKVIGSERQITCSDTTDMPYTMAVISEIQRMGDVVPLGVPHMNIEDATLCGYHIPAGTTVLVNLHRVHFNPNYWDNPNEFKPERFLDPKGKFQKPEELIPFSMGKRVCLGEALAKVELFIFFSSMLQRFTFVPVDDEPLPSLEGHLSITYKPKPYKVTAIQR